MIRHLRRRYLAVSILVICAMMAVGCNQGAKEPVDPPPKIKFADVNGVVSFACSPDGQLLAVCFEKEGTKRRIGIWELATGEQKTEMDEPEGAKLIAFTPEDKSWSVSSTCASLRFDSPERTTRNHIASSNSGTRGLET